MLLLPVDETGVIGRPDHAVRADGQAHPAFPSVHSAATGEVQVFDSSFRNCFDVRRNMFTGQNTFSLLSC